MHPDGALGSPTEGHVSAPKRPPVDAALRQRIGRLLVVGEGEPYLWRGGFSRRRWICQCDCGKVVQVRDDRLKRASTLSCGCLREASDLARIPYNLLCKRLERGSDIEDALRRPAETLITTREPTTEPRSMQVGQG